MEYFRDALSGDGKVFAANSERTYAMTLADEAVISPMIYDPNYIPFLLQFCREQGVKALLSLFDIDLLVLARHRADFEAIGTKVILADAEAVEICNDKWKTHELVQRLGFKSPLTYRTLASAEEALAKGELMYPVILKPRWGMASMGIYTACNDEEMRVLYAKSSRDVFESYLKYESAATRDEAILIQQRLAGLEHGLDIVNDLQGEMVALFAKRKITMRAGETDVGATVDPEPFRPVAEVISKALRHEGVLSLDCFVCSDGIYVIELNCRISGHYPLSHLAGANVPAQIIGWLRGGQTDHSLLRCSTGVRVVKDIRPQILNEDN